MISLPGKIGKPAPGRGGYTGKGYVGKRLRGIIGEGCGGRKYPTGAEGHIRI